MPRIPQEEIERLKREVSVQRLVEARGVALKKHGENLIGLCPFHDDHEPSLVVSASKNLWHCLGACQAGGSVIDWVMRAEKVSFRHAAEFLRAELGGRVGSRAPASPPAGDKGWRREPLPFGPLAEDRAILREVVGYYEETLKGSGEALDYLAKRGFGPGPEREALVGRFHLGYANRTLGYRLPSPHSQAGREVRDRLAKLGVLRETGHEHFSGSLVIPVIGEDGGVAQMYGRKVLENLRSGTAYHLYLPGPLKGVWNVEALGASKEIILCEALLDAMSFWHAGYRNVTSSYGIEGFTADHLAAFKKHGTQRVLIAYDRDDAGEGAASKLSEKLTAEGMECFRIEFPQGQDANEFAVRNPLATEAFGVLIRKAVWLGKGKAPAIVTKPVEEAVLSLPSPPALPLAAVSPGGPAPSGPAPGAPPGGDGRPSLHEPRTTTHEPTPGREGGRGEAGEAAKEKAALPLAASESVDGAVAASPVPSAPKIEIPTEIRQEEVVITLGDRRYRIRGLAKNQSYDLLKVNLLVGCGEAFHVDTLDLYSARQRAAFMKQAAEEVGLKEDVLKKDMGKVLQKLESLQDEAIKKTLEPKEPVAVKLSDDERAAALDLLNDPNLLARILRDFERCGVVGEETNKLMGYLAAVSRKLSEPLAVIIQSSSSAGKSALMEAILAFIPEEERIKYSAMTGQSLFYMEGANLKHKVLAIVEEEGVEKASYALKLLQSEGELTIASTGKDPETGKLVTHEYRVEGPVMIFLTTTAIEIDEELLNRALVLTVNEDREQTRAIHEMQRAQRTLEGLMARDARTAVLKVHKDAQRLLRSLKVVNPYARRLTFLDDRTRTRRDHMKYLTLIDSIALLHQRQRPVKRLGLGGPTAVSAAPSDRPSLHEPTPGGPGAVPAATDYIEVTLADIEVANRLAHEVFGRSLDELPPQTRRLLDLIHAMVRKACEKQKIDQADYRFSMKDVRVHTGWGNTQLKHHVARLVDMEYLLVHRGGRGQSFVYELLYRGEGESKPRFVMGLLDVETLRKGARNGEYDGNRSGFLEGWSGVNGEWSGSSRGQVGPESGGGRVEGNAATLCQISS